MRHGDLSNATVPRIVVVFENALGYLPDDRRAQWRKLAARGRWDDAADLFELDQQMLRKVADLGLRHGIQVDIVTYCGPVAFARAIAARLDWEHVPVSIVFSSTPERMARRLSFEPDLIRVYDANPGHALVYGKKGTVLEHHTQLGG